MRYLLIERDGLTYGQDFLARASRKELDVATVRVEESANRVKLIRPSLVATHDMTHSGIARSFASLPEPMAKIAHVHLNWGFMPLETRELMTNGFANANVGIVPASYLLAEMRASFPQAQWLMVRNGVREDRFCPTNRLQRHRFRKRFNIPADAMCAGFVGRLEPAKGLQVLEGVAARLKGSSQHLVIQFPVYASRQSTNENQMRAAQRVRSLAPTNVHLIPDTSPLRNARPIRYLDLIIHPSLSEVASLVAIEAWMSGVPIVATNSSPFYIGDGVMEGTKLIELPRDRDWRNTSVPRLKLDSSTAQMLADEFYTLIQKGSALASGERVALAQKARSQGFGASSMIERFRAIYDSIEKEKDGA